jgi:hypothetical protein
MSLLQIFQTVGAAVGLVTGAFVVYDRLLRFRPFVSIYTDLDSGGAKAWPYLRVTNNAPFDIFVDDIVIKPRLIGLSQQTTVRAIVDVLTDAKITAVIQSGESAYFHIIEKPKAADTPDRTDDRIKIKVHWYRSMPSFIRPLASTIVTSIDDIEARKRAAVRVGRRA